MHFFLIAASLLIVEMPFANRGFAAVHMVTATGNYEMGEADSMSVAKQKALDEAKRNAAEQVGVYVETNTVVENNKVTKDTIILMTAQFMHIQGEPVWKRVAIGDFGTRLTVTINACIDDDDLNTLRNKIDDKFTLKQYEELQSNYNKLQEDNQNLKLQLETIKKEKDRKQIIDKLSANEEIYQANNNLIEFQGYNANAPDYISKGDNLLDKTHHLLDKNLSMPTAIPLYLNLGIDELTLEIWRDTKTFISLDSQFRQTDDPIQKNQLYDEFIANRKSQAQRYYDISTYYINFAESLSNYSDDIKRYSALETYYGYKAIALKMMGDSDGASTAIKRAKDYVSRIPKASEYYTSSLANIQAIERNVRTR